MASTSGPHDPAIGPGARAVATVGGVSRHLRPALVLSAWTLLVWTTRIRNIWTADDLSTNMQIGRTVLALVFTAFAVGVVFAALRSRTGTTWSGLPAWVRAFAVWTIGVWIVRAVQIALADHGAAFIAVHVALAVISIGLSIWADRSIDTRVRRLASS